VGMKIGKQAHSEITDFKLEKKKRGITEIVKQITKKKIHKERRANGKTMGNHNGKNVLRCTNAKARIGEKTTNTGRP